MGLSARTTYKAVLVNATLWDVLRVTKLLTAKKYSSSWHLHPCAAPKKREGRKAQPVLTLDHSKMCRPLAFLTYGTLMFFDGVMRVHSLD